MTSSLHLCHPYVWEDPRYIFKAWSTDGKCVSELVNRIVITYAVCVLVAAVLSSVLHKTYILGLGGLLATCVLIPTFASLKTVERFKNTDVTVNQDDGISEEKETPSAAEGFKDTPGNSGTLPFQGTTTPDVRNPFHNILVDEYTYAPTRDAAPDITTTKAKVNLDAMFRTQWYSDPTDVFGKTQSQRIFVTQPSTTIPNDQASYQDWLYKIPGKTCKEGNPDACWGGTDGGVLPWLNL